MFKLALEKEIKEIEGVLPFACSENDYPRSTCGQHCGADVLLCNKRVVMIANGEAADASPILTQLTNLKHVVKSEGLSRDVLQRFALDVIERIEKLLEEA